MRNVTTTPNAAMLWPTLGDSSENTSYVVNAEQAFAKQPLGVAESPSLGV